MKKAMKMKKAYKILLGLVLVSAIGCNPLEDTYDDLDQTDPGLVLDIEYTLTSSDYNSFASKTDEDTLVAENDMFADFDQAKRLIPEVLEDNFSYLGEGSSAVVTFEVNGGLEELSSLVNASNFYVDAEELENVDEAAGITGFLSPSYDVEESLITVLEAEVQSPLEGDVLAVIYDYATKDPIVDFESAGVKMVHREEFATDISGYTSFNVEGPEIWAYNQFFNGNAAMAAYNGTGPALNEDWIVSPMIDLTDLTDAELRFHQVINFLGSGFSPEDILFVNISTDFAGDVTTATWTQLTVDVWPAGNSWSEEVWSTMDISAFDGQQIYVGFEYNNADAFDDPTWEVGEVIVEATASVAVTVVEEPTQMIEYYTYAAGDWEPVEGVYALVAADYDAMGTASGLPGRYDNFSSTAEPEDYLPTFLADKFPYAIEEDELTVTYKYYNGSFTGTRADIYTYLEGEWIETMVTLAFGFDGDQWVPDNTIKYALSYPDYQAIGEATAGSNAAGSESVLRYSNFDISLWSSAQIFDAITAYLKVLYPGTEEGQKYLITYDTWEPGNGTAELYVIFEGGDYVLFTED
jgi:hypothetical protein